MYTAPFDVEVEYPNGSTTTISSNQDTKISGLAGSFGGNSYTITTLDVFDCSQTVSLSSNLTTSFLVPINKMVMQLIVLETVMPPLFFLFKNPPSYTVNWYLDSISGPPLYSNSTVLLVPHQIQQSNM